MAFFETEDSAVLYTKDTKTKIATITLNRPEKKNFLRINDYKRMIQMIEESEWDDDVKVILMRGNGGDFCAGHDVNEIGHYYNIEEGQRRASQRERLLLDRNILFGYNGVYQRWLRCLKATVVEAKGINYGSGALFCLNADIVVAADDSKIIHPGWRYVGPSVDALFQMWTLTVGVKKMKEMMLIGRPLEAQEAYDFGLFTKVVPKAKVQEETMKMALAIAQQALDGIVMGKAAFETTLDKMGVADATQGAILHAWSTNIRFEPGEWNLLKERRDKGVKGAIHTRDDRFKKTIGA